jgi:3-hydroxy-9,10-secoandrosta-1,3,5(10)-triene-9,17-dione monooxygenase
MMRVAESGEPIPVSQRAAARWESAHTVARCLQAVDRLFEASGGRAIYLSNPIQRAWRDIHAMRAHAINNPDEAGRLFGSVALRPGEAPTQGFL